MISGIIDQLGESCSFYYCLAIFQLPFITYGHVEQASFAFFRIAHSLCVKRSTFNYGSRQRLRVIQGRVPYVGISWVPANLVRVILPFDQFELSLPYGSKFAPARQDFL